LLATLLLGFNAAVENLSHCLPPLTRGMAVSNATIMDELVV
jgi:hypothetical protein